MSKTSSMKAPSWPFALSPSQRMTAMSGVRDTRRQPHSAAPITNASSSGDVAWYVSSPLAPTEGTTVLQSARHSRKRRTPSSRASSCMGATRSSAPPSAAEGSLPSAGGCGTSASGSAAPVVTIPPLPSLSRLPSAGSVRVRTSSGMQLSTSCLTAPSLATVCISPTPPSAGPANPLAACDSVPSPCRSPRTLAPTNAMTFCVSVPVLSDRIVRMHPSSSFRLVVRHCAGVSVSSWYMPRSRMMK